MTIHDKVQTKFDEVRLSNSWEQRDKITTNGSRKIVRYVKGHKVGSSVEEEEAHTAKDLVLSAPSGDVPTAG